MWTRQILTPCGNYLANQQRNRSYIVENTLKPDWHVSAACICVLTVCSSWCIHFFCELFEWTTNEVRTLTLGARGCLTVIRKFIAHTKQFIFNYAGTTSCSFVNLIISCYLPWLYHSPLAQKPSVDSPRNYQLHRKSSNLYLP